MTTRDDLIAMLGGQLNIHPKHSLRDGKVAAQCLETWRVLGLLEALRLALNALVIADCRSTDALHDAQSWRTAEAYGAFSEIDALLSHFPPSQEDEDIAP